MITMPREVLIRNSAAAFREQCAAINRLVIEKCQIKANNELMKPRRFGILLAMKRRMQLKRIDRELQVRQLKVDRLAELNEMARNMRKQTTAPISYEDFDLIVNRGELAPEAEVAKQLARA